MAWFKRKSTVSDSPSSAEPGASPLPVADPLAKFYTDICRYSDLSDRIFTAVSSFISGDGADELGYLKLDYSSTDFLALFAARQFENDSEYKGFIAKRPASNTNAEIGAINEETNKVAFALSSFLRIPAKEIVENQWVKLGYKQGSDNPPHRIYLSGAVREAWEFLKQKKAERLKVAALEGQVRELSAENARLRTELADARIPKTTALGSRDNVTVQLGTNTPSKLGETLVIVPGAGREDSQNR